MNGDDTPEERLKRVMKQTEEAKKWRKDNPQYYPDRHHPEPPPHQRFPADIAQEGTTPPIKGSPTWQEKKT